MIRKKELLAGIKVEMEHTNDPKIAERIALDHLEEIPDYYTRLLKMEKQAMKKKVNGRGKTNSRYILSVKQSETGTRQYFTGCDSRNFHFSTDRTIAHWFKSMASAKKIEKELIENYHEPAFIRIVQVL